MRSIFVFVTSFLLFSSFVAHAQLNESMGQLSFEHRPKYLCPMHSHITSDHEGECPICGMDLVPQKQNKAEISAVNVSGDMQQAMALTTASVEKGVITPFIDSFGKVQFDETGLHHLHPRAGGWIEKLAVNSLGQYVEKGELLYEMYSPDLLVAQEDFVSLLSSPQRTNTLLTRGRRRLQLLGLNPSLIKRIETSGEVLYRVPYYAEQSGIVSALNIRQGMFVEPNDRIMTVADLSKVWVILDVFEHQQGWLKTGQEVMLDFSTSGQGQVRAVIEYVYPTLSATTQTLQARLVIDNPAQQLKPDMFARARIYAEALDTLHIPSSALIQTAKHNKVIVQSTDHRFQLRQVEVGAVVEDRVQVIRGLKLGERVVTSGQFLLDAEASLLGIVPTDSGQ